MAFRFAQYRPAQFSHPNARILALSSVRIRSGKTRTALTSKTRAVFPLPVALFHPHSPNIDSRNVQPQTLISWPCPVCTLAHERPAQLSPQNARCSNSRCLLRFCTLSRPVERRDTLLSPAQWLHPPSTDPRNFTPKHALLRDAHCVFFASTPAQYRSAQFSPPDTQFLYSLPDPNTRPVQTRATSPPNTLFFFALRIVTSLRPQPSNTDSHNSRLQTLASSLSPTRY